MERRSVRSLFQIWLAAQKPWHTLLQPGPNVPGSPLPWMWCPVILGDVYGTFTQSLWPCSCSNNRIRMELSQAKCVKSMQPDQMCWFWTSVARIPFKMYKKNGSVFVEKWKKQIYCYFRKETALTNKFLLPPMSAYAACTFSAVCSKVLDSWHSDNSTCWCFCKSEKRLNTVSIQLFLDDFSQEGSSRWARGRPLSMLVLQVLHAAGKMIDLMCSASENGWRGSLSRLRVNVFISLTGYWTEPSDLP